MAEHKVIEKADSEEEKKKRKLLIIKIIPVAVLAFILIAVSLAWFTIDKALDLDSFGMKSVDSPFELKTVGSANVLKAEILDSNDYSKVSDGSNITSDENNKIYWLLDEESGMTNGINPGSHGKLTFYVIPKQSGEMEIRFKLGITGYAENKNGDSVSYEKVTDENVTNFLNGHIMFFEKYDGSTHTYSDFLSDETFTRTFKDCKADVPQEVNVYWVWPNTLGQILMKSTDENLTEKNVLFDDDSEERLNFAEYIKGNLSLFLSGDADKEQNKKAIENILNGDKYSTAQLSSLSSMYNDADEKIGTKVQYILVELNV
ncbi:hypothetical protein [Ruminococcus bicirculans (ex Wegman et al. 2014)]|uniref:hypothetical protein n=1 Tax=Ruminococcus bicirculans (ex Wegman et al. 2014) TaxID=1160721 RepID=UPI00307E932D